ncbi:MAG TPA: CHAT domain-containing protein [Thermoanaerobaculia bacterium]|jgi:CHAT domain-containing protein
MVNRSGRAGTGRVIASLLAVLFCAAAAAPYSAQKAYRDARAAVDRGLLDAAAAQTAAALARAGHADDESVAALRVLHAEILLKQGNSKARALLEPELPPRFRTSEAAIRRLIALASIDPATRVARLDEARKLAVAHQPKLLVPVHIALANTASDLKQAESHLATALRLARHEGDLLAIATINATRSHRYTQERRYAEAEEAGRDALATFVANRAIGRVATTAGNLGWLYSDLGDWERARELFEQAEAAAAQVGASAGRARWENQIGNVHFEQRRYAEADGWYARALSRARTSIPELVDTILTNRARTALESGRLAEARQLVTEALASEPDAEQAVRTSILDARIAMANDENVRAEKTLRDAAAKAKHPAVAWAAEGYLAQLYARTNRNELAETMYRRAIETARRTRAAIKDLELRVSFFNTSAEIFNSYIDFLVRNRRIEDALTATEIIRAQTLEEGLELPASVRSVDARAAAKQQGATILSYWLGRERSHLWIVTAARVTHVELSADSSVIERETALYRRDLLGRNGTLQRSGARGQQLYLLLVEPAHIAKGARVIVVADGALHSLNFEALVVPGPTPHYWIEDAIVSSASSLQLLAHQETKQNGAASMLLVGDPDPADAAFPKLALAANEIGRVARHFDQRVVLKGTNATPAAYRAATPQQFRYLHFVAHGTATRKVPLDSAVILSRDPSRQYKLYARDIIKQPLRAQLVTISSCHGAGERTYAGEGLVGLAWAFLRAGASQVIAALWEVNDSAAPVLMDRMYAGIRAGRDPAVALRDAKLALLKGKNVHQMPKYWAPFVLYSGR